MWLAINEQYSINKFPYWGGVNVAFYSDSNMTHGDLCSVKYISVVNYYVLCYTFLRGEKKVFMSRWMEVFVESLNLKVLKF